MCTTPPCPDMCTVPTCTQPKLLSVHTHMENPSSAHNPSPEQQGRDTPPHTHTHTEAELCACRKLTRVPVFPQIQVKTLAPSTSEQDCVWKKNFYKM